MKFRILLTLTILLLESCASIPQHIRNTDCSKIDEELNLRYSLFNKLSEKEIARRKKIDIQTYSSLDKFSVFSQIVKAVKSAPQNAKMIPIDLRNYGNVALGNVIFTNYANDSALNAELRTSKFSQGFFGLMNFGKDEVTIVPPLTDKIFAREKIYQGNLRNAEIVINVSDSKWLIGNMKFAPNQKISILADRIAEPYRLDLRENSGVQFQLKNKWIMPVYSIEKSDLRGGKDTSGFFQFVNNKNTKRVFIHKFDGSEVACYKDPAGEKF